LSILKLIAELARKQADGQAMYLLMET